MLNRLQKVEKRNVKKWYKQHPLYKALNVPCKQMECEMNFFRLAPEEVFVDTLATLDRIKEDPDEAKTLCDNLWNNLYSEYRDVADSDVPETELVRAVSITMLSVAVCLDVSPVFYYNKLVKPLLHSVSTHCPQGGDDFHYMITEIDDMVELRLWIQGYMESDEFMTNEDGMIDMADDDGGKCVTLTQALGQDAGRTIHVENMNIFGGNSRQVSTQGGPAFNDGIFNGGTKFSTDKSPEIKSLEQKKK